jgi:hypothetical protein
MDHVDPNGPPDSERILCPSAQPTWEGSIAIAVVDGGSADPHVIPLKNPQPVSAELLALTAPVRPTEVLRFAAPCAKHLCRHFVGDVCTLIERAIENINTETPVVPYCRIRTVCRWWRQEGKAACIRCSQVVTEGYPQTEARIRIGTVPDGPSR